MEKAAVHRPRSVVLSASVRETLRCALVVSEDHLRAIDATARQFFRSVMYRATCTDKVTRAFKDVEHLLQYENPRTREIVSLRIECLLPKDDQTLRVEIANTRPLGNHNVKVEIEGSEEFVEYCAHFFKERFAAMQPWYARLVTFTRTELLATLFVGLGIGFLAAVALGNHIIGDRSIPSASIREIALFLLLGVSAALALLYVNSKFSWRPFPLVVFSFGDGKQRHEHREWIRRTIVAVAVSATIGLLVRLA